MLPHQSIIRKNNWLAWVLLSAGLIATALASIYLKMDFEADAKKRFRTITNFGLKKMRTDDAR